jgi:hypothetical protein
MSLKTVSLAGQLVEVLFFVISSLLSGKQKAEVQRRFAKLGLIQEMAILFPKIKWVCHQEGEQQPPRPPSQQHNETGPHGPGCDCNPEAALQVQFLRVILYFCDRECDNPVDRTHFLHPDELSSGVLYLPSSSSSSSSSSSNKKGSGLLSNLIEMLMKEPVVQSSRYWLTSCIGTWKKKIILPFDSSGAHLMSFSVLLLLCSFISCVC